MVYLILALCLLFVTAGFVITESNAPYILSSTVRHKLDFEYSPVIKFSQKFHILLALSFTLIALCLLYAVDENAAGIFIVVYPILAYFYLFLAVRRYIKTSETWSHVSGIIALVLAIGMVAWLVYRGLEPNTFLFEQDRVVIEGAYGISLAYSDIAQVEIIQVLPNIKKKKHGYAIGAILKGDFKTSELDVVRIIADERFAPFVKITTVKGREIYLTSSQFTSSEIKSKLMGER